MQWTGKMIAQKIIVEGEPVKVNPNGVDMAPAEVWEIPSGGIAKIHGSERTINPEKKLVKPVGDFYVLPSGLYEIRINCKVKIPANAVGFCHPRSTLTRLGILKAETAVWDSGYEGFGTVTFWVAIREARIHKDEAWVQFTVRDSHETDSLYDGHWQGETLKR